MPTVPRYNQPQVREQGYSNLQVRSTLTKDDFGYGLGEVLQKAADVSFDYAMKEKKKADELVVTEAMTQLQDAKRSALYDPKKGLMGKSGKDAIPGGDEAIKTFDEKAKEIQGMLVNDSQRDAFNRHYTNQKMDLDDTVAKHSFVESKKYDDQVTQTGLNNTLNDIVDNYNDPKKQEIYFNNYKTLLEQKAEREGLKGIQKDEWVRGNLESASGKALTGVIDRKIARGDLSGAMATYQKNADKISGFDKVDLDKRFAVARRDSEESAGIAAANWIESGRSFEEMPDHLKARLSVGARSSLREYESKVKGRNGLQTDWTSYYDLKTLAADPSTSQKFMDTDLMTYRSKLEDSEFKELVNLQTNGRNKGKAVLEKNLSNFLSDQQYVSQRLTEAGIDSKKDKESTAEFKLAFDKEVSQFTEANKRKPNRKELEQITDVLLINKTKEIPFWFDSTKRAFQADDDYKYTPKSVPSEQRGKIVDALKRSGVQKPTEDQILKIFLRKYGR